MSLTELDLSPSQAAVCRIGYPIAFGRAFEDTTQETL
jgi:hypothetical protein